VECCGEALVVDVVGSVDDGNDAAVNSIPDGVDGVDGVDDDCSTGDDVDTASVSAAVSISADIIDADDADVGSLCSIAPVSLSDCDCDCDCTSDCDSGLSSRSIRKNSQCGP